LSFTKATDLLRLAEMATARHAGVCLADIEQEFSVDRRTAQRMTRVLEDMFPACTTRVDDERRKFWRLDGTAARLMLAQGIRDSELAALEISILRATRDGASNEVKALQSLRDRLLASMARPHARRAESDAEAVLEAYGFASRPGPRVRSEAQVLETVAEALKGPNLLTITYAGGRQPDTGQRTGGQRTGGQGTGVQGTGGQRTVEPYGMLLGTRRYLVAKVAGGSGTLQHFRLDRITSARLEPHGFARDPLFNLETHTARAFGSYHAEDEYGEIVWRFSPRAAAVAQGFLFHPQQTMEAAPDGSLIVRFTASGHLEMAWHLYLWGDAVEVLSPDPLRQMVAGFRRSDFPALP
jgi:predicted DNA-binding transcriptional regulator YafY